MSPPCIAAWQKQVGESRGSEGVTIPQERQVTAGFSVCGCPTLKCPIASARQPASRVRSGCGGASAAEGSRVSCPATAAALPVLLIIIVHKNRGHWWKTYGCCSFQSSSSCCGERWRQRIPACWAALCWQTGRSPSQPQQRGHPELRGAGRKPLRWRARRHRHAEGSGRVPRSSGFPGRSGHREKTISKSLLLPESESERLGRVSRAAGACGRVERCPSPDSLESPCSTRTSAEEEKRIASWSSKDWGVEPSCWLLEMTPILCVRAAKCQNSVRIFILSYVAQALRISRPHIRWVFFTANREVTFFLFRLSALNKSPEYSSPVHESFSKYWWWSCLVRVSFRAIGGFAEQQFPADGCRFDAVGVRHMRNP